MRENRQFVSNLSRPVEIKEITIMQFQPLPFKSDVQPPRQKQRQNRLDVPVEQEGRRVETGSENRHMGVNCAIWRPGSRGSASLPRAIADHVRERTPPLHLGCRKR